MSSPLGIIDVGVGNVGSVANMCRRIGVEPTVISEPEDVAGADRLLFPGVGAWDSACRRLHETGMAEALTDRVGAGTPILGICLGMQLLLERSEEGELAGLGWIPGRVARLPSTTALGEVRIPHMGWTGIDVLQRHEVLDQLDAEARYYFVHSYAAAPTDPADVLATASYGDSFAAVIGRDNVLGTQFHPEKSHRHGKALLTAFLHGALVPS